MKLQGLLTQSEKMSLDGSPVNEWPSVGMVVIAAIVNPVGVERGKDEEELVKRLGATQYIDSRSQNAAEELNKLGGAKVILGTVPSGKAMSAILGGLAVNGKLIMIGVSEEPVEVPLAL